MKKKVLSLLMATAFILFGIMTFSCATDSDSGSNDSGNSGAGGAELLKPILPSEM